MANTFESRGMTIDEDSCSHWPSAW